MCNSERNDARTDGQRISATYMSCLDRTWHISHAFLHARLQTHMKYITALRHACVGKFDTGSVQLQACLGLLPSHQSIAMTMPQLTIKYYDYASIDYQLLWPWPNWIIVWVNYSTHQQLRKRNAGVQTTGLQNMYRVDTLSSTCTRNSPA